MDPKKILIDRIDELKDALKKGLSAPADDLWTIDRETGTHTVEIGEGEYKITIVRRSAFCEYTIEHPRFSELPKDVPVQVMAWAKSEALDWTRAHVLGYYEPQHVE